MDRLLEIGASNAAAAVVLALIAAVLSPFCKNPRLRHALWLLVLAKLVTPPLLPVPVCVPDWVSARQGVWKSDPNLGGAARRDEGEAPIRLGPLNAEFESAEPPLAIDGQPAADRPMLPARVEAEDARQFVGNGQPEEKGTNDRRNSAIPPAPADLARHRAESAAAVSTRDETASGFSTRILATIGAGVWILGTILVAGVLVVRVRRFRRLIQATDVAGETARAEAEQVAKRLGVAHCPTVRLIDAPLPPMVWSGGFQAVLLLPRGLWRTLARAERELLLAHELTHIRRGDHWVRRFEMLVLAIYWWHPVAWWASRRLQQAEEECCDAAVIAAFPQDAETYGETLLAVCDFVARGGRGMPVLSSGFGREKHLKRRLTMILENPGPQKGSRFVTVTGSILGFLAIACSWKAVVAQKEPAFDPPATVVEIAEAPSAGLSTPGSAQATSLPPAAYPSAVTPARQQPVTRWRSDGGIKRRVTMVPETVTRMVPVTETLMVAKMEMTPSLSGNVQKQLIAKLLEGVKDADSGVARQSLEGLARTGQADIATDALLALLDRAAHTREEQIERLSLAAQMLAAGIAQEKVVPFLTKTVADSGEKLVRIRAIDTLVASAAGNTSVEVVRTLIATAEKRDVAEAATVSGTPPAKAPAPTKDTDGTPSGGALPADAALIHALIHRAQVGRRPSGDAFVLETFSSGNLPTIYETRMRQHVASPDGRIEREITKRIGEYNDAFNKQRWAEAEKIALQASALDPRHEAAITMLKKARAAVNAAKVMESASSKAALSTESLSGAARFAIEQIVPQTDEVAVALMEALGHKDPQIRRAAAHALANAVKHDANFGRDHSVRVGERVGELIGEKEGYEEATRRFGGPGGIR